MRQKYNKHLRNRGAAFVGEFFFYLQPFVRWCTLRRMHSGGERGGI